MRKFQVAALALFIGAAAAGLYVSMLPGQGGAARCAQRLGWNPLEYGASYSPQWLINSSFWWDVDICRFDMPASAFARLRAAMQAEGWEFTANEYSYGTVTSYYFPLGGEAVLGDGGGSGCRLLYSPAQERLYVEYHFGASASRQREGKHF